MRGGGCFCRSEIVRLIPAIFGFRNCMCDGDAEINLSSKKQKCLFKGQNNMSLFNQYNMIFSSLLHPLPFRFTTKLWVHRHISSKRKCSSKRKNKIKRGGEMSPRNGSQTRTHSGQESTKAERGWKVVERRQSRQVMRKKKGLPSCFYIRFDAGAHYPQSGSIYCIRRIQFWLFYVYERRRIHQKVDKMSENWVDFKTLHFSFTHKKCAFPIFLCGKFDFRLFLPFIYILAST